MGLAGMGVGGAAGWVATGGNPLGAMGGAWLGDKAEGYLGGLIGGGGDDEYTPYATRDAKFLGSNYDYGAEREAADSRGLIQADYYRADQDRLVGMQDRQRQMDNLARVEAQARGEGVSVAELQRQAGQEQAMQQSANLAASARGGGAAQLVAQRQAQQAQMMGAQSAGRDAAMLRADEIQKANALALQGAGQMRGQTQADRQASIAQASEQGKLALGSRGQNDSKNMGLLQAQLQEAQARAAVDAGNADRAAGAQAAAMGANSGADAAAKQASAQKEAGYIGAGGALLGGIYAGKK